MTTVDSNEPTGERVADVIDALRAELTTYYGLDELREDGPALDVYERVRHRLSRMPDRLKDEVIVALVSRQAYPLAHRQVHGRACGATAAPGGAP